MSSEVMRLTNTLNFRQTQNEESKRRPKMSALMTERVKARSNYERFSSHSKDEQKELVRMDMTSRRGEWKKDHYRINSTFSVFPKR